MAFNSGGSIFGAPKPATGGLFGQPNTTSTFGAQNTAAPAAPSLFGAQQQQPQQPAASGGLFGQPAQQAQQQPAAGGLFGQNQAQPATGGSLFGQPAQQTTQQPAQTGGLFGQQTATQPATGTSTGLFGQQQNPAQPSAGLFGQPAATPAQGSSLFGATAPKPATTGGFGGFGSFGATTAQQPAAPSTGLFGSTQPQATAPATGSTLGNFTTLATRPTAAPQATPTPAFTKNTKFNDLPDEVKKIFENIESHIQGRVQISHDLKQRKLGEEATKGNDQIRALYQDLVHVSSVIHNDALRTRDVAIKVDQAVQDTIVSTRLMDGFRNPQQLGGHLKNHATFPLEFFTRAIEEMQEKLRWYKETAEQIERKLAGAAAQQQQSPQAISATLQAQNATFISLANKTAALDAELQKVKALYTQLWRAKTGSMRDPFEDASRPSDTGFDKLYSR